LSDEFRKKYCQENNIKLNDYSSAKLNLDKYKLKAEDLKVLKITSRKLSVDKPDALRIAVAVMASKTNLESWSRVYKATFESTPEEMISDINEIEI
jgi:hypothetical protein